jgi:subtilase family serine protease
LRPRFAPPGAALSCSGPRSAVPAPSSAPTAPRLSGHVPAEVATAPIVRRLDAAAPVHLSIGLRLRHADGLHEIIREASDPLSPAYRQYLTPEQVAATFAPTEEDYQEVIDFARARGLKVEQTFSNRLVVQVSGAAADVERAFDVQLNVHRRADGTEFFAPSREPAIGVTAPVLHITGLDSTFTPHKLGKAVPLVGSGPTGLYDAHDLRAAYASCTTQTGAGQILGLFELDGYDPADILAYNQFGARTRQVPLKNVLLDGATGAAGNGSDEVTADIELANAMAPGLSQIVVFEVPLGWVAETNSILAAMTTTKPLALQLSNSWSVQIDATSQQLFDVMAAQGQSFFTSSGDAGSYRPNTQAIINGQNITLVGGTVLTMNGSGVSYKSETAWTSSGGGIECCEPRVPIPSYQVGIDMSQNHGSTKDRNSPDVSMVATRVLIVWRGSYREFIGTSDSAPLWAGFNALANRARARARSPCRRLREPRSLQACRRDLVREGVQRHRRRQQQRRLQDRRRLRPRHRPRHAEVFPRQPARVVRQVHRHCVRRGMNDTVLHVSGRAYQLQTGF